MGRRAKNKQAAPEPIEPKAAWTSKKQLGKRKAEADNEGQDDGKPSPRPAKRVKDLNGKGKEKEKAASKSKPQKTGSKKNKAPVHDDESGSEGWEDVEDDEELQAHTKCVFWYLTKWWYWLSWQVPL